jgi:lactate racemase
MLELPYGRSPLYVDLAGREVMIVRPGELGTPPNLTGLLERALDAPIGRPRIEEMVGSRPRITLIISDPSRAEPRAAFVEAIMRRLPTARWTFAIATGTHGPCDPEQLGLPAALLQAATVVNHDGHRPPSEFVDLGVTTRGTPIRVHRCLLDADLVIPTGCIRPHYFAGFGAGVKAIFPGLGEASAIRINHTLKTAPGSRAGIVDGNPCREDLEEAVGRLPTPVFLVNGVAAPDSELHAVVAGDPCTAFRHGAAMARRWFTVRAPRVGLVVASDVLPVTASLYQAAKIAAAVAALTMPGGALVVAAECADGVGPLEVVNDAILRIGVLPRLAPDTRLYLLSSLARDTVETTLMTPIASIAELLERHPGPVVVVPRASQLIIEAS